MEFTADQKKKIDLFRASVRLQDPNTERDPVYQFTDEELWDIISLVVPVYSPTNTIDTLADGEFMFPLMLARKEVYYRLATSTAPFYPLEAQGAKLEKNVRFDHYMLLIRQVDREYRAMKQDFLAGDGIIRSYEAKILANYHSYRNYNVAERQKPSLSVVAKDTSVECTWTRFDTLKGLFGVYKLFITDKPIIDEFAEYTLDQQAQPYLTTPDINRLKWRVTELLPDTTYIATLLSIDRNQLYGYAEQTFRTLP